MSVTEKNAICKTKKHCALYFIVPIGILLFTGLSFLSFDLTAQTVFFNHIAQEDGLSNGNVRAIVKDHQGFIWIGTEDGLHRYDGYSMKIYRNAENDSTSVSSNFILCLFEDSKKNLWIGTLDGSLCVYDRKRDNFRRFKRQISGYNSNVNDAVRAIFESKDGHLYVGSSRFTKASVSDDLDAYNFTPIPLPLSVNVSDKKSIRITSIVENLDGNLLVSINEYGLFNYDIGSEKFSAHEIGQLEKNVQTMFVDKRRNLIWTGSWTNGLLVYDPRLKRHIQFHAQNDLHSLRSNMLTAMATDAAGNIWIATDNGLSVVPTDGDPFVRCPITTYLPNRADHTSLQGSVLKAVYVDNDDKLWVGTYYEGINVYDRNSMNFGTLSIPADMLHESTYANVNAIQEDALGNLWIGLDGGGLFMTTDKLGQFKSPRITAIPLCHGIVKIKAMKIDHQNLWIGTWGGGLLVLNTVTRKCKTFDELHAGAPIGNEVISLETDAAGHLWIGTFDEGLFRYTMDTNQLLKIGSNQVSPNHINRVDVLLIDHENNVWVGKEVGGLNFIQQGSDVFKSIVTRHLTSSTSISAIYEDRRGMLWIGVPDQGLVEYDPLSKESKVFGEKEGLANSMIYAIREDSLGRLWLSSNIGISLFEKSSGKFTNFTKANGLSASQFNRSCAIRREDGNFIFGNTRGLNFFRPDQFVRKSENIRIVFTKFFLDNVEQPVGKPGSVLHENITTIEEVRLLHHQNSFSVEFAALNFNFINQTEYLYKLEGFDTEWQQAGNRRLASYTNLAPKEYFLRVKAANANDKSSYNSRVLRVVIVPAWWQTLWFKLGLILGLTLLAITLHRLRIRYLLTQQQKLEALVHSRTETLNDTNALLNNKIEEINSINIVLHEQQAEIVEKNNEIQTQNEELTSQNEHIAEQHDRLVKAQERLKEINSSLEKTVDERTEKLRHTIDDLNKTVFELDRFVYSASHDLSAPLKSILGLVGVIHLEKDPEQLYIYIEYIRDSVVKLETVLKSMVDFARNNHALVRSEKFDLNELINEVVNELAFLPGASRLTYRNESLPGCQMRSDRVRVKVVLHNLIGNGIKYADRSKSENWISINCTQVGRVWQISITDNGIGVRKEYLDKIFNMYFRATEKSNGSGLGLFIVKETLNKIGGTISVESDFGVQTTFTILLPEN